MLVISLHIYRSIDRFSYTSMCTFEGNGYIDQNNIKTFPK